MQIRDLQASLRHFAAERDWQQFHSPKNLSTALMVETAELAKIFQWMTADESCRAHESAELKASIGDEVADVMLYLLQVADHTQVDLTQAVQQKLLRKAEKYPRLRTIEKGPAVAARPVDTHVLLDYENVQPDEVELRALVPAVSDVWVFHGPHQKQVNARFTSFGARATSVPIGKSGKNALDFLLSYYMGYITSRNPNARFVVVANDKGYDPMLAHAKELGFAVDRRTHPRIEVAQAVRKAAAGEAPTRLANSSKSSLTTARAKKPVVNAAPVKKATTAKKPAVKKSGQPMVVAKKATTGGVARTPAVSAKVLGSLRKMGNTRPAKLSSLRATIKMLLGTRASPDAVSLELNILMARGVIAVNPGGDISYRL